MPLITVKAIEGVFSRSEKERIAAEMTDVLVNIAGENLRPATWVVIQDVASGEWSVGGRCLTTEDVLSSLGK